MRKRKPYKLEILWEDGVLTETDITETERELIEQFGGEFILLKYWREDNEEIRPVSFQVWDKKDEPLFPVGPRAAEVPA